MEPFNWVCPFCNHAAAITNGNYRENEFKIILKTSDGLRRLLASAIACPNAGCQKLVLKADLFEIFHQGTVQGVDTYGVGPHLKSFDLVPSRVSLSKTFPPCIPHWHRRKRRCERYKSPWQRDCLLVRLR